MRQKRIGLPSGNISPQESLPQETLPTASLPPGTALPETPSDKISNAGYAIYDFSYTLETGLAKNLTMAIWYPSPDDPKSYSYNRNVVSGLVAFNGKISKTNSPYPLVVFSHGYTGCGTQSVYFTQYLASRGYIVAAPDHEDASLCSIKDGRKKAPDIDESKDPLENFPNRPQDLIAVINEMLRLNDAPDSMFYRTVNENAIGISGHSLGGWDSQILAGAGDKYKDSRVKAGLFLAPNTNQINSEDFKKMDVPKIYILGENDLNNMLFGGQEAPRRIAYDNAKSPKFLLVVKGAVHFTFADSPTCLLYKTVERCQSENEKAKTVLTYAAAFFDRYLKNDSKAEQNLVTKNPLLAGHEYSL